MKQVKHDLVNGCYRYVGSITLSKSLNISVPQFTKLQNTLRAVDRNHQPLCTDVRQVTNIFPFK